MSPIFVRPVREQLEHDRLVRFLVAKYKRKFEVAVNMGDERVAPVKIGANSFYPDIVLTAGRKLGGLVEVESAESVNNLEALAQWVHFAKARAPFHLYVPVQAYDAARRLCDSNHAHVTELWTYRPLAEGFDLVRMSANSAPAPRSAPAAPPRPKPAAAPAKPVVPKPIVAKPAKPAAAAPKAAKPPKAAVVKPGAPKSASTKSAPTKTAKALAAARKKPKSPVRKPAGARKR